METQSHLTSNLRAWSARYNHSTNGSSSLRADRRERVFAGEHNGQSSTRWYNGHMAQFHPNKEINEVIEYAVSLGWRYTPSSGHAHGQLWCPHAERGGCRWSVWSTPRNPVKHARWLRRQIDTCPHRGG